MDAGDETPYEYSKLMFGSTSLCLSPYSPNKKLFPKFSYDEKTITTYNYSLTTNALWKKVALAFNTIPDGVSRVFYKGF